MFALFVVGLVLLAIAVFVVGLVVAATGAARRQDAAWAPSGYTYVHEGFDPGLRERTAVKREREEQIKRAAARVASSPLEEPRLRAVGRVQ